MNVGKMAVQLTANAAPLLKGVDAVNASMKGMGKQAKDTADKVEKETKRTERNFNVVAFATTAIKRLALATGVGGLSAGGALFGFAKGVGSIIDSSNQAARLGLSINELRAAMLAAGPATKAMEEALGSLSLTLANARAGSIDATRDLRTLGVQAGAGTLEALGQIADRLASIPDPAMRSALAFRAFGSAATELLPFLEQGSAGLARSATLVQRLGLSVNANELNTVREVARIIGEVKAMAAGVGNQLVLGISPIVAELGRVFDFVNVNFSGVKDMVIDVAEAIARAGAAVVAAWSDTSLITTAWRAVAAVIRVELLRLREEILPGREFATGFMTGMGMPGFGLVLGGGGSVEAAQRDADRAMQAAGDAFRSSQAMRAVDGFFDRVRQRTQETARVMQDANPAAFYQQQLQQFNQMRDSARNPAEAFQQSMAQINNFQQLGLFNGQSNMQARFAAQAFGQLRSSVQLPQIQQPGAALRDSREAYSAIVAFQRPRRNTVQEEIRALLQEARRMQAEEVRIGTETLAEIRRSGTQPRGI